MKMIVGLGNPDKIYENTRHNVGYMIVDEYSKRFNINNFKVKYNGLYTKIYRNGEYYIILKPLSYMNLSGTVVSKFANFYKIKSQDIMIIHDDLDLPLGRIRIKSKGSSGGHNGIKNIIECLNTEDFARFKIGISKNSNIDTKEYVLGKFNKEELEKIKKIFDFSSNVIEDFLDNDIERVKSKYNGESYEIK